MVYLEEFLEDLNKDLEQRIFAPSIKFLAKKYYVKYGKMINERQLQDYMLNDNRFVRVNDTHFASRLRIAQYIDTINSTMEFANDDKILEKLKEKLFLKEIDKSILQHCRREEKEYQYELSHNSLILVFKEEKYNINSLRDLIDVGLSKGYLSTDTLKEASKYFDIHHNDIVDELVNKGIEVRRDDSIKLKILTTKRDKPNNTNKEFYYKANKNILLTDLRMNELITCIFLVAFKEMLNSNYISKKHLGEIDRIKIADVKEKNIIKTFLGNEITSSFKKYLNENYKSDFHIDLINKYENSQQLSKSADIKALTQDNELWDIIRNPLRNLFLAHEDVHRFKKLILLTNQAGKYSMFDIVEFAIINDMKWELDNILIGQKATSGIKPIQNGSDICFSCKKRRCKTVSNNIKKQLLFYRFIYVDSFIKDLKKNLKTYKEILNNPILVKFLVPYNLTSKCKIIMQKINILENNQIYHKKDGEYCPFMDKWVLKR